MKKPEIGGFSTTLNILKLEIKEQIKFINMVQTYKINKKNKKSVDFIMLSLYNK